MGSNRDFRYDNNRGSQHSGGGGGRGGGFGHFNPNAPSGNSYQGRGASNGGLPKYPSSYGAGGGGGGNYQQHDWFGN